MHSDGGTPSMQQPDPEPFCYVHHKANLWRYQSRLKLLDFTHTGQPSVNTWTHLYRQSTFVFRQSKALPMSAIHSVRMLSPPYILTPDFPICPPFRA